MQHLPDIPLYLLYKSVPQFYHKVSDTPFFWLLYYKYTKTVFKYIKLYFERLNELRKLLMDLQHL